jgi:NAD+ diphosphatase
VLENNLKREVREELGVEIGDIRYLDSHMWTDIDPPKITIVFTAKIISGIPNPCDTNEVTDVKWWTMEDALKLELPPHVARVIKKATA